MKAMHNFLDFKKSDLKIYILLLSAPLLLSIYRYHGYAHYFGNYFPSLKTLPLYDLYAHFWQFFIFFILMFVIPLILIKVFFKESLSNYGLKLGDKKFGLIFALASILLLVVPLIYIGSKMPDVCAEYPLAKILLTRHDLIYWYEAFYVIFYYFSWEFFFRGFLLFGLKDRFGGLNAVLIQTISSCLVHIGKPESEIIGAIIVGIILGIVALRTRSIWYVFLIHVAIGVLTDVFIISL